MRFESQLSRIYCQMFSTGLSSGDFGGRARMVMLGGMSNLADRCLVLLADTSLVLEPDFYLADVDRFFARDFTQARWEFFLKSSIAPSACA